MSVHYRIAGDQLIVFGRTFDLKERLKQIGARFNFQNKTWSITDSAQNRQLLDALCGAVGGGMVEAMLETRPLADPAPGEIVAVRAERVTDRAHAEGDGSAPIQVAQGLSLRDLVNQAQLALAQTFPSPVWVIGEVHNLAERPSGLFLTLAEEKETGGQGAIELKATLWRGQYQSILQRRGAASLQQVLQEGLKLRVLVNVSIYPDRGQLSLNVLDIDPSYTKGAIALQREQILKELRAKGLDKKNKMLPLTNFPLRIGLITADGSRAMGDFLDQLQAGDFFGEVLFAAAQMQGESTAREVVAAISLLESRGVDLIVLTRGGGSAADLRWFDQRDIALKIANCPVPLIAAIGHHDDTCVAEEICFLRQKTPTAAAEFILEIGRQTKLRIQDATIGMADRAGNTVSRLAERLSELGQLVFHGGLLGVARKQEFVGRMREALGLRLDRAKEWIQNIVHRLEARLGAAWQEQYLGRRLLLERVAASMGERTQNGLNLLQSRLTAVEAQLVAKDPKSWLQRGWTRLSSSTGMILSAKHLKPGEHLVARMIDGRVKLTVNDVELSK